jgi:hypothetical protein
MADTAAPGADAPQHMGAEQHQPEQAHTSDHHSEIARLRTSFEARLVLANLRTEAVRAGMIDLDGLKLIDTSSVTLDENDRIARARELMENLRRSKPWLFGATVASSSSPAAAPPSQPIRQKTALEMTDEEYQAARASLVKRRP